MVNLLASQARDGGSIPLICSMPIIGTMHWAGLLVLPLKTDWDGTDSLYILTFKIAN